jgi:hypothetical protein
MNRKQYTALSYTSLISFCFVFRNTGADKGSGQSPCSTTWALRDPDASIAPIDAISTAIRNKLAEESFSAACE